MSKQLSIFTVLALLISIVSVTFAPSVYAHGGSDEDHSTASHDMSETFEQQKQKKLEEYKAQLEQKREEVKQRAEKEVEAAKNKVAAKTKEIREKNCEARKEALGNKIKNTSEAAKRHYDKVTSFNEKIEVFVTNNSVTVDNIDLLKTNVATAAAKADATVAALTNYEQQVDCANIDEATAAVVAYKELLTNARDALKEYRTETKELLVAVKTAVEANKTEGAN
jgi:hypothetical protein